MKRTITVLFAFLLFSLATKSQAPVLIKVWEKVYGGQALEQSYFGGQVPIFTNTLGEIFLATSSYSANPSGNKQTANCGSDSIISEDFWLLKLDGNGNKIWEQTYGGVMNESISAMTSNGSGGYYLFGVSESKPACEKTALRYGNSFDFWLLSIDSNGIPIWDKRYGSVHDEYAGRMYVTSENNLILIGASDAIVGNDVTDSGYALGEPWILKLDSAGTKIWDNRYGGNGYDNLNSMVLLADGSYIYAGGTGSNISGDVSTNAFSWGRDDNWILKTDSAGNKIWDKRYGCLNSDDIASASIINHEGNLVIGASLSSNTFYFCDSGTMSDTTIRGFTDCWIYEVDSANGNIKKEKRFGGDFQDIICQIIEMPDKGYLLGCLSNSDAGFEKSEDHFHLGVYNGLNDWWIVRMDSDFNIVWDKTIGGYNAENCPTIVPLDDSTFIIGGITSSDTGGYKSVAMQDSGQWGYGDIWICKFQIANSQSIEEVGHNSYSIYPNPATDMVYITPNYRPGKRITITAYDINGALIYQQLQEYSNTTIPLDVSSWRNGVYILSVNGLRKRLVKM